jgi:hypothetical protein
LIKIRKAENETERMKFIKLPWELYKNDKFWVPPLLFDIRNNLNPKKNPFFLHSEMDLFLAESNGKLVGRIAAIKNDNHNSFHKEKTGFFGFFETIDDEEVSDLLLDTVCGWCKDRGLDTVVGPVSPSTNDECGLLIDGFDSSPVVMMSYNPRHYQQKIENFGFEKKNDLYAYYIPAEVIKDEKLMAKLERVARIIKSKEGVVTRKLVMKDLKNEVRRIEEVYNNAWEYNSNFVPMTTAEFDYAAKSFKAIVDPDYVIIAEINGAPAGFSMSIPDMNQVFKKMNGRLLPFGIFKLLSGKKKIDMVRIIIMGVKHEYQKRGIDSVFYLETIKEGNKKGVKGGEISWVLDDNIPMRQTAENLRAHIYKTYRLFKKTII